MKKSCNLKTVLLTLLFTWVSALLCAQNPTVVDISKTRHGPAKGHLVIIGGGSIPSGIWDSVAELAGGKNARIVVITNASGPEVKFPVPAIDSLSARVGADRVTRLHLKDIDEANDPAKIRCLEEATGVFFTGGRQWRIAEVYLNTRAHRAMNAILDKGGVIAGTSAGASIQGSFLWRGDTRGAEYLVGDHTQGLGFLKYSVIDQHLFVRNRQNDLAPFIAAAPEYIGIGIDESTAIIVEGDTFEVVGASYVAVNQAALDHFVLLRKGDRFNMKEVSLIK